MTGSWNITYAPDRTIPAMKYRFGIIIVVMLALILIAARLSPGESPPPLAVVESQVDDSAWIPLVEGAVDYQKFILGDPNRVYVARLHRDNPNALIESTIAHGRLSSGLETVRSMYFRYDQAINYWGPDGVEPFWGGRNKAVVAINGFFYDFGTGVPQSGQIQSAWFAKRYEVNGEAEGFVWKTNRQTFMGECIFQDPTQQNLIHLESSTQVGISGLNRDRNGNELVLFTPQYGPSTLTPDKGKSVEVLVEVDGPTRLLQNNTGVRGVIRAIRDGQGSTLIPFDHVVLSAHGLKKDALMAIPIAVGDEVEIHQRVLNGSDNCDATQPVGWGLAYAGIGGYPIILKDGEIFTPDPNGEFRNPRTAIAFNEEYIYFVVVDGRNPGISVGMTHLELATFLRDTLGADWAINQDGGGSSTMVVNGEVVNNTTGNDARCLPTAIVDATSTPESTPAVPANPSGGSILYLPSVRNCSHYERAVANGMMMVVYEPMEASTTFSPNSNPPQAIATVGESTVRLGPGTNYSSIAVVGPGTVGVIIDHANDLEGVQAKGHYWWKVAFGSIMGWVPEGDIIPFFESLDEPETDLSDVFLPSLPE